MTLEIHEDPVPLEIDADGVVRVGDTRVPLDTIVHAFLAGLTAEEIANRFNALSLAEIYYAIGYYLNHRQEIEDYLYQQEELAAEVRRVVERRTDRAHLRARLLARQEASN